jgi:hypothetical protein
MSVSVLVDSSWKRVGDMPPGALTEPRLQLHHAAQIAVSAAISYLPARSDDSHTALTWVASTGALVTEQITAANPFRIGVRVDDLTLHAVDNELRLTNTFALAGRTVEEANDWLGTVTAEAGLDRARQTSAKHYTIPAHPVASGAPFSAAIGNGLAELSKYWSNAGVVLDDLVRGTEGASPVRTWPHHFDMASLIALPGPGPRRTIGVGQSPGDESYSEPYWYVGPYPYPSKTTLPSLAGAGRWHTNGWVGAVLPASDYVAAADQRGQVAAFIDSGVAACRQLLGT